MFERKIQEYESKCFAAIELQIKDIVAGWLVLISCTFLIRGTGKHWWKLSVEYDIHKRDSHYSHKLSDDKLYL